MERLGRKRHAEEVAAVVAHECASAAGLLRGAVEGEQAVPHLLGVATLVVDGRTVLQGVAHVAGRQAQADVLAGHLGRGERDGTVVPGAAERFYVTIVAAFEPLTERGRHRLADVWQEAGEAVVVPFVVDAVVWAVGVDALGVGRGL